MSTKIFCQKLQTESEALLYPPLPGAKGKKIQENISALGWQQWLNHQTMLINEYRLNVRDPKAIEFLQEEMEKFLFGSGSDLPPEYKET